MIDIYDFLLDKANCVFIMCQWVRCAARDLQTGQEESRRPAHPNQTDLDAYHPGEPHRSVSMVMGCHGVE